MAVGESAGTVYVTIDGDASPLIAKYAQAESASRAAGQKIGTAFTSGGTAGGQASGLVDQFGRSIQSVTSAQVALVPATNSSTQAILRQSAALHGSVTEIQAVSGAIRTFDGNQGIRAAERFLTMIPGIGAGLQGVFPIIGAIAFAEIVTRTIEKFTGLSEEEKKATEEAANLDREIRTVGKDIDQLNLKFVQLTQGGTIAKAQEAAGLEQKASGMQKDITELEKQITERQQRLALIQSLEPDVDEYGVQSQISELRTKLQKAQLDQDALRKQARNLAVETDQSAYEDEVKGANAATEAANKASADAKRLFDEKASQAQELARIGERQLKETLEEGKQRSELLRFNMQQEERYAKEQEKLQEEAVKKAEQLAIQRGHAQNIGALGHVAVGEVEAKGAGESQELAIEGRKIALEEQYSAQLLHTSQQQIQYLRQIADLERQASDAKIAGVVAERQIAEAEAIAAEAKLAAAQLSGDGGVAQAEELAAALKKVAELTQQINALEQRGANQQAQAQGRVSTAQAQSSPSAQLAGILAQWGNVKEQMNHGAMDIVHTLEKVPEALARAIVQGRGLGQAFKSMGKELATALLTDALKTGLSAVIHGLGQVIPLFARLTGAATAAAAAQKAVALASVATAAGEGAAWGFESVMAALPFPANIAVAPEVAAATFASIMGFGAFAAGTDFAPGGMALVGERGPELVNLPRGSQVIPNHMLGSVPTGGAIGSHVSTSSTSTSNSSALHIGEAHFHGVQNVQQLADAMYRQIPRVAKNRTATQSPYSR